MTLLKAEKPHTRSLKTPMLRSSPTIVRNLMWSHDVEHFIVKHHEAGLRGLGVLLAVELGGVDHVRNRRLRFLPLTGLEPAVRVNPELIWAEVLKHFLDSVFDLLLARNTG